VSDNVFLVLKSVISVDFLQWLCLLSVNGDNKLEPAVCLNASSGNDNPPGADGRSLMTIMR